MFWVFAINETAEREKHSKRISPQLSALVRLGKLDADKAAEQLAAAVDDHMKCVRAKPLADFEMPSSAEEYADVLRKTPGFRDIAIKARVLAPPSKDGAKPGQRWVALHELADIDPAEQSRLRGILDGGAFAPRSAPCRALPPKH